MPFLLIRCSWFLSHSLSHGSVVPGGSSTDTSVLVQSLDSLRTPRHGHLAASWHRCHAGKGCARSAGQIGSTGRAEGDSCFPKDVHDPPELSYGCETFILMADLMMWTLAVRVFSDIFKIFFSATGQVADPMRLNGQNPAGRNKEGRGTHFPGISGNSWAPW